MQILYDTYNSKMYVINYSSIIIFAQIFLYPKEVKFSLGVEMYDIQKISYEIISLIFKSIKPEIVLLEGFCGNNDW